MTKEKTHYTMMVEVDGEYCYIPNTEMYNNIVITHYDNLIAIFKNGKKFVNKFECDNGEPINIIRVGFIGNHIVVYLEGVDNADKLYAIHIGDLRDTRRSTDTSNIKLNIGKQNIVLIPSKIGKIAFSGGMCGIMTVDKPTRYIKITEDDTELGVVIEDIKRSKFERILNNSIVIKAFLKHTQMIIKTYNYDNL